MSDDDERTPVKIEEKDPKKISVHRMTLRDAFAMVALIQGMYYFPPGEIAEKCYKLADQMIEARK
jgi:hypothetical protein